MRNIQLLFFCGLLLLSVFVVDSLVTSKYPYVTLEGKKFYTDIADHPAEQTKGLSKRRELKQDQAMLFVFSQPDYQCMWMKDMKFNIDILWFDENGNLIHGIKNAEPSTYPEQFCPPKPAKYVLEVAAGQADILNLAIGSSKLVKPSL